MDFLDDFIMYESVYPSVVVITCGHCGNSFEANTNDNDVVVCNCPHCGNLLQVEV